MSDDEESRSLKPRITFAASAGQDSATSRRGIIPVLNMLAMVVVYYATSAVIFHNLEGWSVVDCIYFTTVTLTTVGFGV